MIVPAPPVGCVIAVRVSGTRYKRMADRAGVAAERRPCDEGAKCHALPVRRVGVRADRGFSLGIAFRLSWLSARGRGMVGSGSTGPLFPFDSRDGTSPSMFIGRDAVLPGSVTCVGEPEGGSFSARCLFIVPGRRGQENLRRQPGRYAPTSTATPHGAHDPPITASPETARPQHLDPSPHAAMPALRDPLRMSSKPSPVRGGSARQAAAPTLRQPPPGNQRGKRSSACPRPSLWYIGSRYTTFTSPQARARGVRVDRPSQHADAARYLSVDSRGFRMRGSSASSGG